jgi:hypothetical protein
VEKFYGHGRMNLAEVTCDTDDSDAAQAVFEILRVSKEYHLSVNAWLPTLVPLIIASEEMFIKDFVMNVQNMGAANATYHFDIEVLIHL